MTDHNQFTPQSVMDASLTPDMQAKIASERPDLLPWLAANPSLYPELREWLATNPDPRIQAALLGSLPAVVGTSVPPVSPETSSPRQGFPKRVFVVVGVLVAVLAVVGGLFAVFYGKGAPQSASAGANYKGYDMQCGVGVCVGIKDSGDALVLTHDGNAVVEEPILLPPGSKASVVNFGQPTVMVVSPDEEGVVEVREGLDLEGEPYRYQLPADSTVVAPGVALSDSGTLWGYGFENVERGEIERPVAVPFPWPIEEFLEGSGGSFWVLGQNDDGATFLGGGAGDERVEIELPGEVRQVALPLLLLDDGTGVAIAEGTDNEFAAQPAHLPGKAVDATSVETSFDSRSILVLLEDGSVLSSSYGGNGMSPFGKLELAGKAVSINGEHILLDDGTIWNVDSGTEEGNYIPVQVSLPGIAKKLMGGGWILLEDEQIAYVGSDSSVPGGQAERAEPELVGEDEGKGIIADGDPIVVSSLGVNLTDPALPNLDIYMSYTSHGGAFLEDAIGQDLVARAKAGEYNLRFFPVNAAPMDFLAPATSASLLVAQEAPDTWVQFHHDLFEFVNEEVNIKGDGTIIQNANASSAKVKEIAAAAGVPQKVIDAFDNNAEDYLSHTSAAWTERAVNGRENASSLGVPELVFMDTHIPWSHGTPEEMLEQINTSMREIQAAQG